MPEPTYRLVSTEAIEIAPFYARISPEPGEVHALRDSMRANGFLAEYPIVVIASEGGERFTLVEGRRRYLAARELGLECVPALVKAIGLEECEKYALENALCHRAAAAPVSVIRAIVLSWAYVDCGGEYSQQRILRLAACSLATYKRAVPSLRDALQRLRTRHPKRADASDVDLIAWAVANNVWPELTQVYTGELGVAAFRSLYYETTPEAQEARRLLLARKAAAKAAKAAKDGRPMIVPQYLQGRHTSRDLFTWANTARSLAKFLSLSLEVELERDDVPADVRLAIEEFRAQAPGLRTNLAALMSYYRAANEDDKTQVDSGTPLGAVA